MQHVRVPRRVLYPHVRHIRVEFDGVFANRTSHKVIVHVNPKLVAGTKGLEQNWLMILVVGGLLLGAQLGTVAL